MHCTCGFDFLDPNLATKKMPKYESFAVIRDRDYSVFLKRELKIVKARDNRDRLHAIGHSAEIVGSIIESPQRSRLLFMRPGADQKDIYVKEAREDLLETRGVPSCVVPDTSTIPEGEIL